jgi:hypothetical protein
MKSILTSWIVEAHDSQQVDTPAEVRLSSSPSGMRIAPPGDVELRRPAHSFLRLRWF